MKEKMDNLVQGLREELIQYGEMLTLLEEQQEMIVNRSADGLIQNLTAIHSQMAEIAKVRDKRDEQRHDLAKELDQDGDISFRDLIGFLPSEYQSTLRSYGCFAFISGAMYRCVPHTDLRRPVSGSSREAIPMSTMRMCLPWSMSTFAGFRSR